MIMYIRYGRKMARALQFPPMPHDKKRWLRPMQDVALKLKNLLDYTQLGHIGEFMVNC